MILRVKEKASISNQPLFLHLGVVRSMKLLRVKFTITNTVQFNQRKYLFSFFVQCIHLGVVGLVLSLKIDNALVTLISVNFSGSWKFLFLIEVWTVL